MLCPYNRDIIAADPQHPRPFFAGKRSRTLYSQIERFMLLGHDSQRFGNLRHNRLFHVTEKLQRQMRVLDFHPRNFNTDIGPL